VELDERQIAKILRLDKKWIPESWILRPQFKLWPPRRQRAVLWLVAQLAVFSLHTRMEWMSGEYIEYTQHALTKMQHHKKRLEMVGKLPLYLRKTLR
jgi:hypothetical protein